MFVGNSITRHGIKHDIGWHNDWGMAASALEKDYVHIVAKEVLQKDSEATFCVCQAAEWECNCYDGEKTFEHFKAARDFKADIIIMRLVENCPRDNYNSDLFIEEYGKLVSYLNGSGKAKIIITTGFWKHIADGAIREYAHKNEYPLVELNDLGEDYMPDNDATLDFVEKLNAWRRGNAEKYLHTGKMVKPIEIITDTDFILEVKLGKKLIKPVLTSRFEAEDGSCGQIVVNFTQNTVKCSLSEEINPLIYHSPNDNGRLLESKQFELPPLSSALLVTE